MFRWAVRNTSRGEYIRWRQRSVKIIWVKKVNRFTCSGTSEQSEVCVWEEEPVQKVEKVRGYAGPFSVVFLHRPTSSLHILRGVRLPSVVHQAETPVVTLPSCYMESSRVGQGYF